jgi:hypothetical protein
VTDIPLSRSQVLDFVRLEGLQKLTSVTAHDWDLYILKELVDNALDADETDPAIGSPHISVEMEYATDEGVDRSLQIRVRNRSVFPLDYVESIFDLTRRVSVKDYYSRPTRGAQGNALKTILGIPYALNYFYFSTYDSPLKLKPLTIRSGDKQVDLKLDVDELEQRVTLKEPAQHMLGRRSNETEIAVGISRFIQARPRRADELIALAETFALFNPHASFSFTFYIGDDRITYNATGNPVWNSKYDPRLAPPITWYSKSDFRELLHALLKRNRELGKSAPTFAEVAREFGIQSGDFDGQMQLDLLVVDGKALDHDRVLALHQSLNAATMSTPQLGEIGAEHLKAQLNPPNSIFCYCKHVSDGEQPFVLEVTLASSEVKRRILTGINHTTSYRDPFYGKPLVKPGEIDPQRGLDKLLDRYALTDERQIILVVHLIAPNIVYENYGKSAISDEAYRDVLVRLIDEVATEYIALTTPPEPVDYLSEPARRLISQAIRFLEPMPFTEYQLLTALKTLLAQQGDPQIDASLRVTQANRWLRDVILAYHQSAPIKRMVRAQSGRLAIPRHPYEVMHIHFAEHNVLKKLHDSQVRAIVIAQTTEIEELLIALQVPLRYDVAILRADTSKITDALDLLAKQITTEITETAMQNLYPLVSFWVLRNASLDGERLIAEVKQVLRGRGLPDTWAMDFGLTAEDPVVVSQQWYEAENDAANGDGLSLSVQAREFYLDRRRSARLDGLSSDALLDWLEHRLTALGYPPKMLPDLDSLAAAAVRPLREQLRAVVAQVAFEAYDLDFVLTELEASWQNDFPHWKEILHNKLTLLVAADPKTSWRQVLDGALEQTIYKYLSERQHVEAVRSKLKANR